MRTRVMVVDDSKIVTGVLSGVLGSAGYDVESVNSPFDVIDTLKSFRPHLVMMDLDIPGLSGAKIIDIITTLNFDFKFGIAVHSSCDVEKLRKAASLRGVCGCIKKGVPKEELLSTVGRFVKRIRADESLAFSPEQENITEPA
jgi:CheY-like chemotaxis protein